MAIGDPEGIPFIHPQSPIGMIGGLVLIMRERFSPMNKMPWCFNNDPNVDTIHIYPQFDRASEARNLCPRIVVAKGPTAYQRTAVGDTDQNQAKILERGVKYSYQQSETSWSLECIAGEPGESMAIGDFVGQTVTDAASILERAFTIRRFSPVLVQQTRQYDTDKKKWITEVEFRTNAEHRWVVVPAATIVRRYQSELKLRQESGLFITKLMNNQLS